MEIDPKRRTYLDILVEREGRRTAIELKYKMRAIEHTLDGETFSLLNQGAQDIGRYDVLKDLHRLEQMVELKLVDDGFMIFLTNDTSYYRDPGVEKETADREFRIHEGRLVTGVLSWSDGTGEGTMKGREEPIVLEGTYVMNWLPYSRLNYSPSGSIQCLLVPVGYTAQMEELDQKSYEPAEPEIRTEMDSKVPIAELSQIVQSINTIPISQFDLRDKLAARLEAEGYRVQTNRDFGNDKVDIWAEKDTQQVVLEVRYKTALLRTMLNGNDVDLKNQAAQDISRYDFLSDIEKLEKIIAKRPGTKGYAVLITNDHTYWTKTTRAASVDEAFRIHHGRILHGRLCWKDASDGTTKNRKEIIDINGHYILNWQQFLTLGKGKNEVFQMLVVQV